MVFSFVVKLVALIVALILHLCGLSLRIKIIEITRGSGDRDVKQTQQKSSKVHYYEPGIANYQNGRKAKHKNKQQQMYDWIIRVLAFVMIGFSLLFVLLTVKTHVNTRAVVNEKQQVEQSVNTEKTNLKNLENEAELLKNDDYVMKLARSRYYMSKEGEMIFSTPEDNASDKARQLNQQQNQNS